MKNLLYIILAIIAAGCGYTGSTCRLGLDEAQLLLESDPSKAFEKLNEYDVAEFEDSATMARWALLYSEAMAANHMSAPTDTIINIAISYYESRSDLSELNRARHLKSQLTSFTEPSDALVTALYIQKEKEFMLYKERAKRERLIIIALSVILIAAGVIIWQRQRMKLKDARNESLMAEASMLEKGLSLQQSECCRLNVRLAALLANRFGMIDELCGTYYESQGTKTEKKAVVDKVKSQIEALKSDEGIFSEMEKCHEDLLRRFREEIPDLKPDEYRLMVYLASGLSNRTIALLIGESISVAYKRKSRLKAKISESGAPGRELFLSKF